MDLNALLKKIKNHENYNEAGMVLCHNGVVRSTSRDGRKVEGLTIVSDKDKLDAILSKYRKTEGIVDILVEIAPDGKKLVVGDDVMFIVVAGDVRENVIGTLTNVLNEIKKTVTSKTEFFVE